MKLPSHQWRPWLLVAALFIMTAGCGKKNEDEDDDNGGGSGPRTRPTAQVSGTVTFQGQPLTTGFIVFHGKSMAETVQAPIVDGKYEAKVPIGKEVKISIDVDTLVERSQILGMQYQQQQTAAGLLRQAGIDPPADGTQLGERSKAYADLAKRIGAGRPPAQYRDPNTSGLTLEVKTGANTRNIDLQK